MSHAHATGKVALGIVAGGQGSRLGGVDKAWLRRAGVSQVERLLGRFGYRFEQVLVSANRNLERYRALPVSVVQDRFAGIGPIGGIDALAHACTAPWLLTMPVDLVDANDCLLPTLRSAVPAGAWVEDADGVQPLVALWPVAKLRDALPLRIAAADYSIRGLQHALGMSALTLAGVRLGNLNTPADLAAAGIESQ